MACLQLASDRLRSAIAYAWMVVSIGSLMETKPKFLSCKHGTDFNLDSMEFVDVPFDKEEYSLEQVGFVVQPGFQLSEALYIKMRVFPFWKNIPTVLA